MISQKYKVAADIETVWRALTDPKLIQKWSGANAVMGDETVTDFSLWDGDIWGTNTKVVPQRLIEQDWYGGAWAKPSKVVFRLHEVDGITTIELTHCDLPAKEEKDFADGWQDYYFGPMKVLLEANT